MVTDQEEKKWLFLKCKKSVLEIRGWKVFIFLPQNLAWRLFVAVTVFMTIHLCILLCFYTIQEPVIDFIESCCDIVYIVDVTLCMLHYAMVDTRKLRHGKKRHIILIFLDCISLIPLKMVYKYLIYNIYSKSEKTKAYYGLNAVLRIYQIPKGFSEIKSSMFKLHIYCILTFLEALSYVLLLTHFLSCFIVVYFDENQKNRCHNELLSCIVENELVTIAILGQCFYPPFSNYPIEEYKLLLIIDFIVGYLFTYGYIIPVFLFMSLKCLSGFFEYSKKWIQLKILMKNIGVSDKKLKKKILNYFHYVWTYGKGDRHPEILQVFPLSFKKNIYCDLHWDAFRHSDFLQGLSIGCKRSLALCMKTEFLVPHTTLFKKKELKTYFIYLESGILQIMSEENSKSPVISFSGGTVLGEISFFFPTKSVGILKAPQFSVIHVLSFKDFFRVLLDYPKDTRKVFQKLQMRLQLAKSTSVNKREVNTKLSFKTYSTLLTSAHNHGNIKWIKQQYRALMELRKAEKLKAKGFKKESIQMYQRKIQDLETVLEHTSVNLHLICINDETAVNYETVCMKMSFPWMIDPRSQFVFVWKIIISLLVVVTLVVHTAVIGWSPYLPRWFLNESVIITFAYTIDVLMQLITAVKKKNVIVSRFSSVILYRLGSISFYLDVLAALPLQLFVFFDRKSNKRFINNIYFVNALLKTYRLIPIISNWSYSPKPGAFIRSFIKYMFILSIIICWSAALFNLSDAECLLHNCAKSSLYRPMIRVSDHAHPVKASLLRALILVLDISASSIKANVYQSFLISISISIICRFFFCALEAECMATYIMENSYEVEYKMLIKFVYEFMGKHKMIGNIRKRVIKTMEFQWNIDKGNYITQNHRIFDEISEELKKEINQKWLLPILNKSRLFESEDEDFITDLCMNAGHLILPAKSLLVTFGTQPNYLYVIEKGFVQINSFISGDLKMNVSTPVIMKEEGVFPVIDAFSQTPAAVSATAITDCQLIMFDLEVILSKMLIHGVLKDLVETVRETDLSALTSAKLGLSAVSDAFRFDENYHYAVFQRLKFFGVVLKYFLKKKAISPRALWYTRWEWSRLVFIILNLVSWPVLFAFCSEFHCNLIIYILVGLDFISLVDFYIRMHVAYYNEKGIYVVHPLFTSLHYLATSFISDFIVFAPNFHLLYMISKKKFNFHWSVGVIHVLMRSVSLYRVIGLLRYSKGFNKIFLRRNIFFYFLFITVGMHYYMNLMVHLYLKGSMQPKLLLREEKNLKINKCLKYYLNEIVWMLSMFCKVNYTADTNTYNIIASGVLGILGVLTQIYVYSHVTLNSMTANKNLTTYRYHITSFIEYLSAQKTEKRITDMALEQFEYQWTKQKGYDLRKIFSRFPRTLHEDIMFPLYKKTLKGIASLSKANESFYRAISVRVREVYLQATSVIIYEKHVQGDIFFVHKGECFVEKLSKVLYKGSVIGDIQLRGIMKNTITTKTNVKLLKLSSKEFFQIINNYYATKIAFQSEAAEADDFIESFYVEETKTFSKILSNYTESIAGSKFVPIVDEKDEEEINQPYRKKRNVLINPNTLKARIIELSFVIAAYISVIFIPIVMAIRLFSILTLFIIYILDAFWVVKIILTTRTIYFDRKKDIVITNSRKILNRYLRSFNGLILHVLSVLPIELIPLAYFGRPISSKCCFIMSLCYVNRLLRLPFIYSYIFKRNEKVIVNIYKGLLGSLMSKFAIINFCVSVDIVTNYEKKYKLANCHWTMNKSLLEVLLSSYLCVVNTFVGGGMFICKPDNFFELVFRLLISLSSLLFKALFLNHILTIMYMAHHTRSDKMLKLEQLEKYLSVCNISRVWYYRIKKYFCDLLNSFKEGAEPSFLNAAPSPTKRAIFQDIYTHHLSNCYAFQNLDHIFIKQLAERLERNIFFPGDYIVEKGDVDHNIYFIHSGEVHCLEEDENYAALELEVDLYVTGEYFGVQQGVFLNCPHKNTYRAKTLTDILVLNYYKWEDMRLVFPHITESIYKKCRHYDEIKRTSTRPENQETSKAEN